MSDCWSVNPCNWNNVLTAINTDRARCLWYAISKKFVCVCVHASPLLPCNYTEEHNWGKLP